MKKSQIANEKERKKNTLPGEEAITKPQSEVPVKKLPLKDFVFAHKRAVCVAVVAFFIVIIAIGGFLFAFLSSIFRADKVSLIDIGASQIYVREVLGEPQEIRSEGDSIIWYYYEREFFNKLSAHHDDKSFLAELEGTEYKEIRIAFDSDGVCEVLLDKRHIFSQTDDYSTVTKTVKRVNTGNVESFEKENTDGSFVLVPTCDTEAIYSVYFKDGSFYRNRIKDISGTTRNADLKDGKRLFDLAWQDKFGKYNIPGDVTVIGACSANNKLLKIYLDRVRISVPDIVTDIAEKAFEICASLKRVSLPPCLRSIGASAFENCINLSEVYITDLAGWCNITFENSYSNPLYYAHSLYLNGELMTSLTVPSGIAEIRDYAFRGASCFSYIALPEELKTIGVSAFADCRGVERVLLPDSLTRICRGAFEGCDRLAEILLPQGIAKIEHSTFSGCDSLVQIKIPDSVTAIGDYAFFGCDGMKKFTAGSGLGYIGDSAFAGCGGLREIEVSPENETYHSVGNCLIETDLKTLVLGCANSKIPADGSVTSIGRYAFIRCTGLTGLTVPKSIASIGAYAFYGCSELSRITYEGTAEEWEAVTKSVGWDEETGNYTVYFSD